MKKILALLMSVSMMASLFVSTAVTTQAAGDGQSADEITATVSATSITNAGKVKFSVVLTTPVKLDFATESAFEDEDDPDTEYTLYSGTGISTATFKFAFNSEYFDIDSLTFSGQKDYPSVAVNKNENGFAGLTFADDGEKLVKNNTLYTMTITPKFDITGKTVADINNMKCIVDVFAGSEVQLASWLSKGTDKSAVTFKTYTKSAGNLKLVYPDKDAAPATVKVTDITLSTNEIKAQEEATGTVTATVVPDNATTKGVNFKSNDTSVITIDADGNWTAVGAGTTTITVTPKEEGSTVSKTINVTVTAKPAPVASLEAVKAAVSEEVANTGYWIYKLSNFTGDRASYKLTFEDKTAEEKLEYTSGMSLTSEGDVSFALYLTATGNRLGHTFATSVQVDTLSAQGANLTIGTAAE